MSTLKISKFIPYTGGSLDRMGNQRKNAVWVSRQFEKDSALIAPVWRNLNLITNYTSEEKNSKEC